jgi:D-glycero-alpha-D-manno-heptose-7-phosphate kinase
VQSNGEIEHSSVRACLGHLGIEEGVEIHHIADLPARTGLGTSSAFTVGLLLALYALKNRMRDKASIAAEAIHVERDLLRETVGSQDQVSVAYGGFNRIEFGQGDSVAVKPIVAPVGRLPQLQDNLALFFTGFSRTASEIAQEQVKVTPSKQRELSAMLELVDEAEKILTDEHRPLDDFGRLLDEGWKIKRGLTSKISNSRIDEIYEAGLKAGALGGKLLGAGGGGFMLFYVAPERREALRNALSSLLCVPFGFSNRGGQVVVYEPEASYDKELSEHRGEIYRSAVPAVTPGRTS